MCRLLDKIRGGRKLDNIFASNPWEDVGEFLPRSDLSGDEILLRISEILQKWPKETTAIANDKERHLRFISTIAGYPEIDISTRPLDWPMNPESILGMEISYSLDNISGTHEFTSLKSSILNRDLNLILDGGEDWAEDEKQFRNAHKQCLSLLFSKLRQVDGHSLTDANFRPNELNVLSSLHSTDNKRRSDWWPDLDGLSEFENIISSNVEKPNLEPLQGMISEIGKENPRVQKLKKKNEIYKLSQRMNKFTTPPDLKEITFQFHYVQTWMHKYLPTQPFPGTIQRFIRGYSLLLELLTSEILQRVVSKFGMGSVLIHGGGRVSFLCPQDKIEDMKKLLEKTKGEFLNLEGSAFKRIRTTLDNWAEACICASGGNNRPDKEDYKQWFSDLESFLPPISIGESESNVNLVNLEEDVEIIDYFSSQSYPRTTAHEATNCVLCLRSNLEEKEINRIDSWMGLNDSKKAKEMTCSSHRLIYFLGHSQRLKDSSIRQNREGEIDNGDQRTVTAISMLDGNSLGVVFSERYNSSFSLEELIDRKRRRSFRFNYHWWKTISETIEKFDSGDRIAAWVTAGDDVLLAQYQPIGEGVESRLEDAIKHLAGKIQKTVDKKSGIFISFGAGLAYKENKGRILQQLEYSRKSEELAKAIWKSKAAEDFPEMLTMPRGEIKDVPKVEDKESAWINGTKSVLITDLNEELKTLNNFSKPSAFPISGGIVTGEDIQKIKNNGSKLDNYLNLENYIRRGYIITNSEGVDIELVILPPKVI